MKFSQQSIPGVFIIEPEPYMDERGVFRRHFCEKEFIKQGITTNVKQANISENKYEFTLRGFHYQIPPYGEGKTLSCLKGSIYDVVVDLRPKSHTYMKWIAEELNEQNRKSIHVPPGCANAFLTLEDSSVIHYYCSEAYNPQAERGIRYDDPAFRFIWPSKPLIISDKDLNHPGYVS